MYTKGGTTGWKDGGHDSPAFKEKAGGREADYRIVSTPSDSISLLMVPPLEIYFDLRPVNLTVTWLTWLLFYLGFYGLQIMLAFNTMGSFRPATLVMATVSFPIYIRAFINVFSGREQKWHVTGAAGKRVSPFNFMIPQVLMFAFLLLTSVVAVTKDVGHGTITLATAWNLTSTLVFAVFIGAAIKESHLARVTVPAPPELYPTFARVPRSAPRPSAVAVPNWPKEFPATPPGVTLIETVVCDCRSCRKVSERLFVSVAPRLLENDANTTN